MSLEGGAQECNQIYSSHNQTLSNEWNTPSLQPPRRDVAVSFHCVQASTVLSQQGLAAYPQHICLAASGTSVNVAIQLLKNEINSNLTVKRGANEETWMSSLYVDKHMKALFSQKASFSVTDFCGLLVLKDTVEVFFLPTYSCFSVGGLRCKIRYCTNCSLLQLPCYTHSSFMGTPITLFCHLLPNTVSNLRIPD